MQPLRKTLSTVLVPLAVLTPFTACSSIGSIAEELGAPNPENMFSLAAAGAIAASAQTLLDQGTPPEQALEAAEMAAYQIEYPEIVSGLETAPTAGGLVVTTVYKDPISGSTITGRAYVCVDARTATAQEEPCS
jgi:hypothetical protein